MNQINLHVCPSQLINPSLCNISDLEKELQSTQERVRELAMQLEHSQGALR